MAVTERVGAATHLVLDREQVLAGLEAHDVLPAILVLIALFGDQAALLELVMRAREFLGINLQVMAVEFRDLVVGLTENQLLPGPGADVSGAALAILLDAGRRIEDFAIELGDTVGGPLRHSELNIGHAEIDRAKPFLVRLVEAELVAPREGRLDIGVVLLAVEFGIGKLFLCIAETLAEFLERRDHQTD